MSTASVAWKHDIGNWQSRRAQSFRQQQQAMQSSTTTSLARDEHAPAAGRLSGGFFSHRGKRGAAQVTFGSDVVLRTQTPAPPDAAPDGTGGDDVSLSALSCDVSALSDAQRTQAFDDSVASIRQSMVNEAVGDSRMLWVTVFGVAPSLFYDVRTALHERCGPTTTHYWPALSATCNWMYVQFEQSFDAAKAVSLSPIKLSVAATGGGSAHTTEVTVGVEWCRDVSFVRARSSRDLDAYDRLNRTITDPQDRGQDASRRQALSRRRNEPWTGEGLSFLLDASAQVAEAANRSSPALRRTAAYLAPAQRGHWSIVDAVVGQRPTSWMQRTLNRREAPEHRLERLVALSNRTHGARVAELLSQPSSSHHTDVGREGDRGYVHRVAASRRHGVELPVLVAVWSTSPWRLWSNLSTILLLAVLVWWWFWRY